MPDLNISQSNEYCEFCRKPLEHPVTSRHHPECLESLNAFNENEFNPFSEYQDFFLVEQFFSDLMSEKSGNKGLEFSQFLKNSCNWSKKGELETLKIFGGFLNMIPASIGNFDLKKLVIHNNRSLTLPKELENLHNLEHLELHYNSYFNQNYGISNQIWYLSSLTNLMLNGDFSLEGEYSNLKNLSFLSINAPANNKNAIKLPNEIQNCSNLRFLDISTKYLNLDKFSFEGMKLETLQLENNNLNKLNDSIKDLQSLEQLTVSTNKFKEIPTQIHSLDKIKEIDLSVNMISKIPAFLDTMNSLERVVLSDNPLKTGSISDHHYSLIF